jgi:hypothetical protein
VNTCPVACAAERDAATRSGHAPVSGERIHQSPERTAMSKTLSMFGLLINGTDQRYGPYLNSKGVQ